MLLITFLFLNEFVEVNYFALLLYHVALQFSKYSFNKHALSMSSGPGSRPGWA